MAIALDAVTSFNTGTGNVASHTFAHTVAGANRVLLVGVAKLSGTNVVTSVTFNGVALTQVATVTPSTNVRVDLWRLVAPDIGTFNVVITPATATRMAGAARSYTGVDQTTPLGTAATASNPNGDTPTVDVSSATGELVVDVVGHQNSSVTLTVGAGQTQRYQDVTTNATAGNNIHAGGSDEPGAATVTMSWSMSALDDWAIVAVPLKPASAGGISVSLTPAGETDAAQGLSASGPKTLTPATETDTARTVVLAGSTGVQVTNAPGTWQPASTVTVYGWPGDLPATGTRGVRALPALASGPVGADGSLALGVPAGTELNRPLLAEGLGPAGQARLVMAFASESP